MNWFRKTPKEDLHYIERGLSGVLRSVVPREDFLHDLRSRLVAHSFQSVPVVTEKSIANRWLLAGGVAGSLFVLLSTIRGILTVIGLIGIIVQIFVREKRSTASQLAH
ncbi:MAG: hypothetical protein IMY76_03820 [Chloroflexi bacterium]|nr:hypothetical protein [Chloroflexota bacterium]